MRRIRKLRHWKQRFDKNARFVWSKSTTYGNKRYRPGDDIPEDLAEKHTKLRRFWESHRIELAEFDEPNVLTGQVEERPDDWLDGPVKETSWAD
jgi:hypothetical protein